MYITHKSNLKCFDRLGEKRLYANVHDNNIKQNYIRENLWTRRDKPLYNFPTDGLAGKRDSFAVMFIHISTTKSVSFITETYSENTH